MQPWHMEGARDEDVLRPSCDAGGRADKPLPTAPATLVWDSRWECLLQGARHAPALISARCLQVTPALASSLPSPLLRKSTRGNRGEDANRHGGGFLALPLQSGRLRRGDPVLERGQGSWHCPAGPGHASIPHILPRWGALTAFPGRTASPRRDGSLTHAADTQLYQ